MKSGTRLLLIILVLCVTITSFIGINVFYHDKVRIKYRESDINKNNTSQVFQDKIFIEGIEETIRVAKYTSHLGYSVNYDVDNFNLHVKSNGSVVIANNEDNKIYLQIEKLTKDTYYEMYYTQNNEEIHGYYTYNYKFLRSGNNYFKLTSVNKNSLEYHDMQYRLDYMIDHFSV